MKAKERPLGIKHRIREQKMRHQRTRVAVTVSILVIMISISGFIINSILNQSLTGQPSGDQPVAFNFQPKAVIVDQLSLTSPNQTFVETATNTLELGGYSVDYYSGENVTVEFYRNLPAHGYSIIILRVHSTTGGYPSLCLFTCERYSQFSYVDEQLSDRIVAVAYSPEGAEKGEIYFGISYKFVESDMKGKFSNAVIVMMGCEGLNNTLMARAFMEKGVEVYMSWNTAVSASHTDTATAQLLKHFLIEKRTVKQALLETLEEVGYDSEYKSLLLFYPLEAGEQTIESINGKR